MKINGFGFPNPSQNEAKILLKSTFQKTCDFSLIFVRFLLLVARANIDFVLVFTVQNGSRTFFFKLLFAWIWGPKNHPKTSQKPCPGDPKIDLENVLFFNIDFFGFWPRFRRVLGLQDGAKSAALLAAPGVLNPTAFYACINILLCMLKGRPAPPKTESKPPACRAMLGPCWHIFRSWAAFLRSWPVLKRFLHF